VTNDITLGFVWIENKIKEYVDTERGENESKLRQAWGKKERRE
jgi:hypothetical protein